MGENKIVITYDQDYNLFEAFLYEGHGKDLIVSDGDPIELLELLTFSIEHFEKLKEE